MSAAKPGYCYVLRHKAWMWKSGEVVKVGRTCQQPSARGLRIASSSGLILQPTVFFALRVDDTVGVEKMAHKLLEKQFPGCRIRRRRELFRVMPEQAQRAIETAAARHGEIWVQPRHLVSPPVFHVKHRSWWLPRRRGDALRAALALLVALVVLKLGGMW